jgi:hypothetical protein
MVRGSNPGDGEIFCTCTDRPWNPLNLLYNGYRVFSGHKERPEREADPSPLLVPLSREGGAIPLLPLWAVRPVQSLSACTSVHFTFLYKCSLFFALFFMSFILGILFLSPETTHYSFNRLLFIDALQYGGSTPLHH